MLVSQSTHRQTLLDALTEGIQTRAGDDSMPFSTAATRVLLEWLGYELEDDAFIDGSDRGIDAWVATETGFDIFQVKTHQPDLTGSFYLTPFDGTGVRDLQRARTFLLQERAENVQNKKLKALLYRWDSTIHSRSLAPDSTAIPVTLHLVILGRELSAPAEAEFQALRAELSCGSSINGVQVQFHAVLHTVDQVLNARWREDNRQWIDRSGRKNDRITLRSVAPDAICDNKGAVFYCSAKDLVEAYDMLGYQIFEPNVRANIKNSRVNQAIRDSILYRRTRQEFRFLNNGVTITCDNFTKPSQHKKAFTLRHPGIVNGLQTVVALHTAYQQLNDAEKEDFDKHCSVLVRILQNNAVDDITRVVRATNNQNPMNPRNLVSNNMEQLFYAKLFADQLGWFYEAKEGAWDAFEKDPRRWRPPLGKMPRDFRVAGASRGKVRLIDNATLAQTWLSFIGFAEEAVDQKKALFDDRFYQLVFTHRTKRHGVDYEFSRDHASKEAENQSPTAQLMLVAYLCRDFAAAMVPKAAQNRQEACNRLGIDPTQISKSELDARLDKDDKFVLNQVLGNMSLLFTEFVGFAFYRALGQKVHQYGSKILANHSFAKMKEQYLPESLKDQIATEAFASDDLLVVLWLAFVDTIEDLLLGGWGQSYRAASIKLRFNFSRETRGHLYRAVQDTDDFMKKRSLKKTWAAGVEEGQGLFDFIRSCVEKDNFVRR